MRQAAARRLLIAAKDDPVLAAWAYVIHEHKAQAAADVSPYEAWEAFQHLFDVGVISTRDYNHNEGSFFRSVPSPGEIESTLMNLRILPEPDALEEAMKGPLFGKPQQSKALTKREVPTTLTQHVPLQAPPSPAPLGRPATLQPLSIQGAKAPLPALGGSALRCRSDGSIQLEPEMKCPRLGCDAILPVIDLGPPGIAESEIASMSEPGEVQLYASMTEVACPECGLVQHSMTGSRPE